MNAVTAVGATGLCLVAAVLLPAASVFTLMRVATGDITVGLGPVYVGATGVSLAMGGYGLLVLGLLRFRRRGATWARWVLAAVVVGPVAIVAVWWVLTGGHSPYRRGTA